MAKQRIKNPLYKSGDILKHINPIYKNEVTVILDYRHDNKASDVSWWVYSYPIKGEKFAVPERELFPID